MKIGIDATTLAQDRIVGISRFVRQLVLQFAQAPDDHEYYLCYRPRALKQARRIWRPPDPRFRIRLIQEPFNRRLFRQLDLYHATYQRLPGYRGLAPYLGTLHDIFYLSQPETGSARTRRRWQARYHDCADRSRLIMTLSEFSKDEIVRLLGVAPGRVRVVPLAASPGYEPQHEGAIAAVRRRYELTSPYILFGGGFARRKNALGALRAFAAALPRLRDDVHLAISGSGGPLEAETLAFAEQAGIAHRVRRLGFVPDADYPALMAGSLLYFFPTLLEGFGLPALEAMACGAPVVTSSTTSLPEVCADAALLADPADPSRLADALVEMAASDTLRAEYRQRGLRRAREFSWRRVAEMVLALYRETTA